MGETIILAPGANGRELLRSMARFGEKCFNVRICGTAELAELALMRGGVVLDRPQVDFSGELALMAEAVKKGDEWAYFKYLSYSDLLEITKAVRQLRMMVEEGEESTVIQERMEKGIFAEKNQTLLKIYHAYMNGLDKAGIDLVAMVRQALKLDGNIIAETFKKPRTMFQAL